MSEGQRCIPACVSEETCELASTACTGSSRRLATSATLEEPESHGHAAWDPGRCVPLPAWNGASVEAGRPASTALQQSRRDRTSAVTITTIPKVRHVTPSRPVNRGSPMTPYLDFPTPICYSRYNFIGAMMTRVVYRCALLLLRPFWADFWSQIWVTSPVNTGSRVTLYLDSRTPICLFAIQLSGCYDED